MKHTCDQCRKRPALTVQQHGRRATVTFLKDHPLCRQCRRSLTDATRIQRYAHAST